jgi:hypothetical protein
LDDEHWLEINQHILLAAELLRQANVSYEIVDGWGESALSQMTSFILFGDWVSYYLAPLYEADPSP